MKPVDLFKRSFRCGVAIISLCAALVSYEQNLVNRTLLLGTSVSVTTRNGSISRMRWVMNDTTSSSTTITSSTGADQKKTIVIPGPRKRDMRGSAFGVFSENEDNENATIRGLQAIGIFLNVYIPPEGYGRRRGLSMEGSLNIAEEQIRQVNNSYAGNQNVTVHVVTVGREGLNASTIDSLCQRASNGRVQCVQEPHVADGGELDTLQHLYNYCQKAPAAAKAIYAHNKGSFHPSRKNALWRRSMMDAVVSAQCLNPPNNTCDACGLQFAAPPRMFTMLFPGNFFAASCGYIKRLHSPLDYTKRQREAVLNAQALGKAGRLHIVSTKQPWALGIDRYAPEHWIGSHPFIRPCDLSVQEDYWYWEKHAHSPQRDFKWAMWPRRQFNATHEFRDALPLLNDHELRLRSYSLFAGLLYRWINLYNVTPPESSWMWTWLPDGAFWKESVGKYGHDVVDVVTGHDFNRTQIEFGLRI